MIHFVAILEPEAARSVVPSVAWLSQKSEDTPAQWCGDGVVLAQSGGTLPPFPENLPLSRAALTIAGAIRLDNRDTLLADLGLEPGCEMGDAALVLAAWRRWGEDCLPRLLGDFAFLIWDGEKRRLFCCTDHFGSRAIYWHYDGRRFIVASSPYLILAVPGVAARPNLDAMATLLDAGLVAADPGLSWYDGIQTLTGAALLTAGAGAPDTRHWWQPRIGPCLSFRDEGEFREAFQEIFFRAVRDRLRGDAPPAALLSGGLDSSGIVAVAAPMMAERGQVLEVFSSVLPDSAAPGLKDERHYIDLFKTVPNVRINYIHAPGKGFMSDLEALDFTSGPTHTSRHYLYTAFARGAREKGARVLLDGGCGEHGATGHAKGYMAELLLGLRWPSLWYEMRSAQQVRGLSLLRQARRDLAGPIVRPLLARILQHQQARGGDGGDIFMPGFVQDLRRLIARSPKYSGLLFPGPDHRRNELELLLRRQRKGLPEPYGGQAQACFPYMDKRLLEFTLNAPGAFKIRGGYNRNLLRTGLAGILPPEIQHRITKTPFSPDYNRRFNAQAPLARDFLDAIAPNDPVRAIFDIGRLKAITAITLADAESDPVRVMATTHSLPTAVYAIQYLRQFPEYRL